MAFLFKVLFSFFRILLDWFSWTTQEREADWQRQLKTKFKRDSIDPRLALKTFEMPFFQAVSYTVGFIRAQELIPLISFTWFTKSDRGKTWSYDIKDITCLRVHMNFRPHGMYSVRQRREISHMRIINTRDGYFAVWKAMVICAFNFFPKRHLWKEGKIMVQDRNFYRYKFRFSPPRVIKILILLSRMFIVNLRGCYGKNSKRWSLSPVIQFFSGQLVMIVMESLSSYFPFLHARWSRSGREE